MAQTVLNVMFPAEVTLPDGRFIRKGKVFITDEGTVVLDQVGHEVQIVFRGRYAPADVPEMPNPRKVTRLQTFKATTEHGLVAARGALGCACGIRELERFNWDDVVALSTAGEAPAMAQ